MDKLWAPWRSKYIYLRKRKGCIFCNVRRSKNKKKRFIIEESTHSFAMLNLYPYNNAHVMIAPYRHVKSLDLLSNTETMDLMNLVNKIKLRIDKKLKPHGYNIGCNIGRIAGAGYAGHVHIHIVPRWQGDTNFIPVISDTKIISESLEKMYLTLKSGTK